MRTLGSANAISFYIIEVEDLKLFNSSATANEMSGKISVLQGVQFVTDSWRKLVAQL